VIQSRTFKISGTLIVNSQWIIVVGILIWNSFKSGVVASLKFGSQPEKEQSGRSPFIHCEESRQTFRCPFEEYLPDVEKIQWQCLNPQLIYPNVFFHILLTNEKILY
jgi:hypothetical protein